MFNHRSIRVQLETRLPVANSIHLEAIIMVEKSFGQHGQEHEF